jgi:hypothetical protein
MKFQATTVSDQLKEIYQVTSRNTAKSNGSAVLSLSVGGHCSATIWQRSALTLIAALQGTFGRSIGRWGPGPAASSRELAGNDEPEWAPPTRLELDVEGTAARTILRSA